MPHWLLFIFLFVCVSTSFSQKNEAIQQLEQQVNIAKNDEEKINALGELADYYYGFRLEKKADSIQQQQLLIAQLSSDKDLFFTALFDKSITSIGNWTNKETFDRALGFIDKGLTYAKDQKKYDYEALAYIRKSSLLRKRGQYDKALEEAMHAFSALDNTDNDSLRSVLYMELGNIMLSKDDAVSAYKNYNKAYDIAYEIRNKPLQSSGYRHFAALYHKLNNKQLTEEYLLNSVELNANNGNKEGLLFDFIDLSRFIEKKEYIEKVLDLSDELKAYRQHLFGKQLMLAYFMVIEKDANAALNYLSQNNDLKQSYLNRGLFNYRLMVGHCYKYGNQPDSALKYFLMAEAELNETFEVNNKISLAKDIASCYQMLGQPQRAIAYYEKAFQLNNETNNLTVDSSITGNLSKLYLQTGDYKKAYEFNLSYQNIKDELQSLADARQVVLMEMDRENKKHELDMEEARRQKAKIQNLQYMGISIAIIILFMVLILFGMFPVSKLLIRMLGFIAFICLFEFIILLIDNYIHHAFHGDALYIWLFKIGVLAILFPSHHYLEHAMVKFLESKKLMKLRQQISIKQAWQKIRKPAPKLETGIQKENIIIP